MWFLNDPDREEGFKTKDTKHNDPPAPMPYHYPAIRKDAHLDFKSFKASIKLKQKSKRILFILLKNSEVLI